MLREGAPQRVDECAVRPHELRFDRAGNMYVAERDNHVVRRIDAGTRVIRTVAGTGVAGPQSLTAYGALWTFDRPITVSRLPGYHSGPVEQLDALQVLLTVPKSRRVSVRIGI